MRYTKITYAIALSALLACLTTCAPDPKNLEQQLNEAEETFATGSTAEAESRFLRLAEQYTQANNPERVSLCYYYIATLYLNQRDTIGMQQTLHKMYELQQREPNNNAIAYDYLSVRQTYNVCQFEETGDTLAREQAMTDGKRAIVCLEQMTNDELKQRKVNPVWNYYNVAVSYDLYYDPRPTDSIVRYLDKARQANTTQTFLTRSERLQGDISIRDLQAWLYLYDAQYDKAEAEMNAVLALIDTVETMSPNAILTERGEAYAFMVELYETIGQPDKALHYQKLYTDNNSERFSIEKNRALHEVEAQYNIEKKDHTINEMRWLIAGLILIIILGTLVGILRHLNREQTRYEAAVESDMTQQAQHTTLMTIVQNLSNDFPTLAPRLQKIDLALTEALINDAHKSLSLVDKRYMLCFIAGLKPTEIATLFNVEPASIYTVRYRIKKKFPNGYPLPF
ncbi:MAG: hypothetical protein ACI392_04925 [Paludibacteraceae bacterium]